MMKYLQVLKISVLIICCCSQPVLSDNEGEDKAFVITTIEPSSNEWTTDNSARDFGVPDPSEPLPPVKEGEPPVSISDPPPAPTLEESSGGGEEVPVLPEKEQELVEYKPQSPEIYSFHIESNIKYRYSRTYITSRVVNRDAKRSQEIKFRVVLPESAFISKFLMEIDGKTYEAYVKEKEEAKQVYNEAQSQGQSAGLVELNTRNTNVFDVNVNIKAQSKVNFNLTYEELLSRRLGKYEQSINISPEQITNVKDFQILVTIEESQNFTILRVPNLRNDVDAQLDEEGNNKDAVIERPAGNKAKITWKPSEQDQAQLDKEKLTGKFVVQYDINRELDAGEVLVMNGYFVHFFAPANLKPLRKHVMFVLDVSGSMWGRRLAQLKEAMTKILADLSSEDFFNIITFASDVVLWSPDDKSPSSPNSHWSPPGGLVSRTVTDAAKRQPFAASKENIVKAQLFISSLVASGGTNIHDSLSQALNLTSAIKSARNGVSSDTSSTTTSSSVPTSTAAAEILGDVTTTPAATTVSTVPTRPTAPVDILESAIAKPSTILPANVESLIIFLTDGEPTVGVTNPTSIQTLIKEANANSTIPIFSLGFGDGADFPFLRKLSLQNNGFARKIYTDSDAALQLKGFYNEIASPLLSNVKFNYTSPEYAIQNVTISKYPTVFGGTEIAVAGKIVPKSEIESADTPKIIVGDVPAMSARAVENDDELDENTLAVVPTDKHYFDVEIAGTGRDGIVHFNNPEIFSSPIPWGVPVVVPFPPRPTPAPTQEDVFLERLWAYLTIRQLIEKDFAQDTASNEIDDGIVPSPTTASPLIVSTVAPGFNASSVKNVTVPETPKQRALRLALKYGFVTPLTSLVVVKPNSTDVTDSVPSDPGTASSSSQGFATGTAGSGNGWNSYSFGVNKATSQVGAGNGYGWGSYSHSGGKSQKAKKKGQKAGSKRQPPNSSGNRISGGALSAFAPLSLHHQAYVPQRIIGFGPPPPAAIGGFAPPIFATTTYRPIPIYHPTTSYYQPSTSAIPVPRNPCFPSPCGLYSECRIENEITVCRCLPSYIGSPPTCRPECTVNSDCPASKGCFQNKCKEPCSLDVCGENAVCSVENHFAICTCIPKHTGDPFVRCSAEQIVPLPVSSSTHAPEVISTTPTSQSIETSTYLSSSPVSTVVPECVVNADCPSSNACIQNKCEDPCVGLCGVNANCSVPINLPICTCAPAHTGNPFVRCSALAIAPLPASGSGESNEEIVEQTTILAGGQDVSGSSEEEEEATTIAVDLLVYHLYDVSWYNGSNVLIVNHTEYRVADGVLSDENLHRPDCQVLSEGGSSVVGQCLHLKDCVQEVFKNDFSVYEKSYFCSIESRNGNVAFAGACCVKPQEDTSPTAASTSPVKRNVFRSSESFEDLAHSS